MSEALNDIIRTVGLTDREIRRVTRDAAAEADRIVRSYGDDLGRGAKMRQAQVSLAKVQTEMWGAVGDATKVGIGDAVDASALRKAGFDQSLMRSAGLTATHWNQSLLATSRAGIGSFLGRKGNEMSLSQRVYRNRALSRGYVDRALNNGLLLGKSVNEIAGDVKGFISPDTPGGASYAAHRLARTEVVNAYHENSKAMYKETPWIERVKWNLSGSHSKPDICNDYADTVQNRGWGSGEFASHDVPVKPHPNCLCYVTPVSMSLDEYAKNFEDGKYDDYINQQMGCFRVA